MSLTQENWNKQGYSKLGLTKARVEKVHSRAVDHKGKVYTGEAGKQLRQKQLEKQSYYQRNPKSLIGLR